MDTKLCPINLLCWVESIIGFILLLLFVWPNMRIFIILLGYHLVDVRILISGTYRQVGQSDTINLTLLKDISYDADMVLLFVNQSCSKSIFLPHVWFSHQMDFHVKPKLKTLDSLLLTIMILNILKLIQDQFSLLHNLHIRCRLALLLMRVNLMIYNVISFMEPDIDSFYAF